MPPSLACICLSRIHQSPCTAAILRIQEFFISSISPAVRRQIAFSVLAAHDSSACSAEKVDSGQVEPEHRRGVL